ncbi:hypothetical protein [Roseobacter weihaiensis]|uniref:hypothetical protein n=1 Tax=Roseobacter weihaiensis TaxID=2763262 RepID=UPI001D0B4018|nr:hypothetical protein [Roseobacter sp. H9]
MATGPGGVLYDCDMTEKRQGVGWISDKIGIVITNTAKVVVSDAVILQFYQRPLEGRLSRNNDRKLVVRWRLKNIVNGANQTTTAFDYTATITKATNRITVYANPDGYPNRFSGRGTCVLKTAN